MTTPLRVLTQNCCLLPSGLFQSPGADNRAERAQLITQMIQRYDVVLLQEVLSTRWCSKWRTAFAKIPGMQVAATTRARSKLIDSGLMIASRYPIREASFHRFEKKSWTNSLVIDRGFLYVRLEVDGTPVHVINTHLNPNECHFEKTSPEEYRRLQLEEILEFKKAQEKEDEPWVIGGDFNDPLLPLERLPEMSITFRHQRIDTSHSQVPFAIPGSSNDRIDYVVSNRPHAYERRLDSLISDHYGVEAGIII